MSCKITKYHGGLTIVVFQCQHVLAGCIMLAYALLILFAFILQTQSVRRDVSGHLKWEYRAKG